MATQTAPYSASTIQSTVSSFMAPLMRSAKRGVKPQQQILRVKAQAVPSRRGRSATGRVSFLRLPVVGREGVILSPAGAKDLAQADPSRRARSARSLRMTAPGAFGCKQRKCIGGGSRAYI